jgi:hypothetical protein
MIDMKELRESIKAMTRQQELYRVLRDELSALGYWRKRSRGNPREGYRKMKEKRDV